MSGRFGMVNTMESGEAKMDRAAYLLKVAYESQMAGNFETAIELYKASIAEHPTAEAHTFLG